MLGVFINSNNEDDSIARMKAAEEALAKKKKVSSYEASINLKFLIEIYALWIIRVLTLCYIFQEEPSFELSGKLAEETNKYRGDVSVWVFQLLALLWDVNFCYSDLDVCVKHVPLLLGWFFFNFHMHFGILVAQ